MDKALVSAVAAKLGDKARVDGATIQAIVQHDDAFLATRVRTEPVAEVFVKTEPLDGFELAIKWGDRRGHPLIGDSIFDNVFGLVTNDVMLMRAWVDETSRAALLGSQYSYETDDFSRMVSLPIVLTRTWTYELANDEVVATKGAREQDPAKIISAVRAACTLAARSRRWAREYADLARKIGGTAANEVEIGGPPVMTATRSAVDVRVRLLRRAFDSDHLRTLVTATRIGDGRLAVWKQGASRPDLPRGLDKYSLELPDYRLRASDKRAAAKLDGLVKKLLVIAQPDAVIVDADSVDLWFEGALSDFAPLDAAVALAAHLAVDAIAPQGPYR